jgi:hypothetical protein
MFEFDLSLKKRNGSKFAKRHFWKWPIPGNSITSTSFAFLFESMAFNGLGVALSVSAELVRPSIKTSLLATFQCYHIWGVCPKIVALLTFALLLFS